MGAGRPDGGGSPRGSARLQPELSATTRADGPISPLAGAALDALLAGGFDEHEQAELTVDVESLRRRWEDHVQLQDLQRNGFTGLRYEMFQSDLAAYGYPVVRSWIRRGLIFEYCADRGRPVQVTARDRELLSTPGNLGDAADDRRELALETNARALAFFRKHVLLAGVWSAEKGASLNTFYIGACLFAFPNVFQRWAGERRRSAPLIPTEATPEALPMWSPHGSNLDLDPAVSAVSALTVEAELAAMPERTRQVAAMLVNDGASFAEIGEKLGMSVRAVEGLLYRYRFEARRRHRGVT